MPNQQLIDWIQVALARGYTPEQVTNALIQYGHKIDDVKDAMKVATKKDRPWLIYILLAVGILSLASAGIIYFMTQSDGEEIKTAVNKTSENVTVACTEIICFTENFKECKPATATSEPITGMKYFYEIIGPKASLCEVKSRFEANPNPEWVGKEMTCSYDYIIDFQTAVQDMSKCSGELYDLMTGNVPKTVNTTKGNSTHIASCFPLEDLKRTSCYIRYGETVKDISKCDNESEDAMKWYCYRGVGSGTMNLSICDMIPADANRNKDYCIERIAFHTVNITLCETIVDKGAQESCYERIAVNQTDPAICDKISDTTRKELCKTRVSEA